MRLESCLHYMLATAVFYGAPTAAQDRGLDSALARVSPMANPCSPLALADELFGKKGGVRVEPIYIGEVFSNTGGGIRTGTRYQGLLDLGVTLDFQELDVPLPGRFSIHGQNTSGRGLTENYVGDTLVLSNIDSFDNIVQLGEFWWEFGLFDDDVTVRIGKQDVNTDFLLMEVAEDFVQSKFGLNPTAALPTYPNQAAGVAVTTWLDESCLFRCGVWDALAPDENLGFSGNSTVLAIGELEYSYSLFAGRLPGTFTVGIQHETEGTVDGEALSPVTGYVVQIEQMLHRESTCRSGQVQGLSAFAAYYPRELGEFIPADITGDSYAAGFVYRGLLNRRDDDVIGVGVASAELFQGGSQRETVFEFFYKARVTPRIKVQPDLQYIASPSGIHPDALVVGVRFELAP